MYFYFFEVVLCLINYLLYWSLFSSIYTDMRHSFEWLGQKKYIYTMSSYQLAIATRTVVQPDDRLRGQRCLWRETQRCNADGEYSMRKYVLTCTHVARSEWAYWKRHALSEMAAPPVSIHIFFYIWTIFLEAAIFCSLYLLKSPLSRKSRAIFLLVVVPLDV